MASLLNNVIAAAERLEAKYNAEAQRLRGGAWLPRWQAEQKALSARKIKEALLENENPSVESGE